MENIISAINTYGFFTVLVSFAMWGVYAFVRSRINAREKKEKQKLEIEAADALAKRQKAEEDARAKRERQRDADENARYDKLVKTLVEVVQRGPVHTVKEQEDDRRLHEFIQHNLDSLVEEGASRAYYFTFHNGGRNVLGHGLLKMSIFAESVGHGEHIMGRYQSIPRSMFTFGYKKLDEVGDYYITNVEDVKDKDQASYNFLTERDTKAALFRAAKTDDGLIFGFVGVEYDQTDIDFEKQKANVARSTSRIAGAILTIRGDQYAVN